jgi:hypothetical protein
MIPLACPRDDTPLHDIGNRTYGCRQCGWEYVVSITDAYRVTRGWDQNAPGAGAVFAVMEATRQKVDV